MPVNYERNGVTGLATLACVGCGSFVDLGVEAVDDGRMGGFVENHRDCAPSGGHVAPGVCDACLNRRDCWICAGAAQLLFGAGATESCPACSGTGRCSRCLRVPPQRAAEVH